ncbi:uncharacterized protein KY384_003740 [Bacidia gigantensis]|uniref:uncharacterized protein n=1 Tax=Bacidia gigantensis TaxID=2732470 RepID=UPI001D038FF9|nr:uncharacterized protein KY384_003740 [Bacidia gigantensis]KAG8532103.1 hypothetical protein KY384_003740 [Bacidia gigantensis]
MITATKRWLRKNQTNFAIGLGVVGAGYVAGQYVISKLAEAKERMASGRVAKEKFQQNQEDCTITVLELLPTVTENILDALPSESITQELQQRKAERLGRSAGASELAPSESSAALSTTEEDGKSLSSESYVHASQVQLWTELKINSITRAFTLIYTVTLLTLLTRVQLNLLGRRNYLSSVVSQVSISTKSPIISLENREDGNAERSYDNDFETNRKYLTFSWWLLHRGWRQLMMKVETAVKEVFGPLKPTEDVPMEKLSNLILEVRKHVEGASAEDRSACKWLPYLLPPRDAEVSVLQESGVSTDAPAGSNSEATLDVPSISALPNSSNEISSPPLRRILDETADLIDSPLFTHVLTLLLDAAFSELTDRKLRTEAYKLGPLQTDADVRIQNIAEDDPSNASAKLATILAVLTREAHKIGNGMPNEYVQILESVDDLEAFAALIYSCNFDLVAASQEIITPQPDSAQGIVDDNLSSRTNTQANWGIMNKAAGAIDAAWTGFEKAWNRVGGF